MTADPIASEPQGEAPSRPLRLCDVMNVTAAVTGVAVSMLVGPSRNFSYVRARHIAARVAFEQGRWSLTQIGRALGGRDHSTILYAVHAMMARAEADQLLTSQLEAVRTGVARIAAGEMRWRQPDAVQPLEQYPTPEPQDSEWVAEAARLELAELAYQVHRLRALGWSFSGIARHLRLPQATVASLVGVKSGTKEVV